MSRRKPQLRLRFRSGKQVLRRAENGRILIHGKPCYFLGANLWYAPILASTGEGGNRPRLARELDSLAACGITNLRVLVGAEGDAGVTAKIEPILQYAPGQYDDRLLDGLDYLLAQLGQRGMQAVLYLNNSWEWSGGYSQYLAWSGEGKAPIPCVDGYETYTDYVSRFIPNMRARELFENHVRFIVGRTNRYTGLKYTEDPAIFSWQICNEPRPFGTANHEAFAEWIAQTARLIRSLDPNHMISTGSEASTAAKATWNSPNGSMPSPKSLRQPPHLAQQLALGRSQRAGRRVGKRQRDDPKIHRHASGDRPAAEQAGHHRGVRIPARQLPVRKEHADYPARRLLHGDPRPARRVETQRRGIGRSQFLGMGRRGPARTPLLGARR